MENIGGGVDEPEVASGGAVGMGPLVRGGTIDAVGGGAGGGVRPRAGGGGEHGRGERGAGERRRGLRRRQPLGSLAAGRGERTRPGRGEVRVTRGAERPIACFGSVSSATGRPSADVTSCATSGMRLEPPTSTTALRSEGCSPAVRSARVVAATVSSIAGRSIASSSARVSRTSVCRPGSSTGTIVCVSTESASFAAVH